MATEAHLLNSQKIKCHHCHEPVVTPFDDGRGHNFCCQGCQSVFQILHKSSLEEFYSIQKKTGEYTRPVKDLNNKDFRYLNDKDFLKDYASYNQETKQWSLSFYLRGVHCLACLWLIEKLPDICTSIVSSRLDMGKSLVTITLKTGEASFQEAAKTLNNLGYEPYPISNLEELASHQQKEERKLLLKIGVAGFSAMNIMLYTGSVYAGADGIYQLSFGYLSLLLSLPVVFYSALPFYKSSVSAIKNRRITIDFPLSVAILVGFFVSVYFVITNKDQFYFDSITTLVFLILLSRYVLAKAQQTNLNQNDILSLFQRGTIHKVVSLDHHEFDDIHPDQLKVGDLLEVRPSEVIPCDGVIIKGTTRLNLSALTGESESIVHNQGSRVFMGTTNVGNSIVIEVQKMKDDTRVGTLLKQVVSQDEKRSAYSYLTDKVSSYFVNIVFTSAALAFVYFYYRHGLESALEHGLAFIIVTCPCALGLATPLTFSRAMSLAQKTGIIFKSESAIERLSQTTSIFFDKTGTLTTGHYDVTHYQDYKGDNDLSKICDLIFSLESGSNHPVAKSIVHWCGQNNPNLKRVTLKEHFESIGKGVSAKYQGNHYEILTRDKEDGKLEAILLKNNELLIGLSLSDKVREDSSKVLKDLRQFGYDTFLLSGDKTSVVLKVGKKLGFKEEKILAECSPEEKAKFISQFDDTLFIGDGANDSLGLSKAKTSIATHSSLEVSLRVSDIFLNDDRLDLISKGLNLSKKTMQTIKINLTFSIFYNAIGAFLALGGYIGPLEAAILMPLSSLTVLLITLYRTREI